MVLNRSHRTIALLTLVVATLLPQAMARAYTTGADVSQAPAPIPATVIGVYQLPATPLSTLQPAITNDRKITLGSAGSDLWRGPGDGYGQYWMVTDRGPNKQIQVDGKDRRIFPTPEFSPSILLVKVGGGAIKILKNIPIAGADGTPVTGLPNIKGHDDRGYNYDGKEKLPYNPSGIDTEGLVRTRQGDFWIVDEYGPSLVHIAADGRVIKRYVPDGLDYSGANYPVQSIFPSVYAYRDDNRGFEGLALSPDNQTLYILLQSPLSNPDSHTAKTSHTTRILVFDIPSESLTAEYAYPVEDFASFDPSAGDQADMKVSGLAVLGPNRLLALERTNAEAKLYTIDFSEATNLLHSKWDDPGSHPSLEQLGDLPAVGIQPVTKSLAVDLTQVDGIPSKVEGVVILDSRTLAVANDNDFALGGFDADGNNIDTGDPSEIVILKLATPLK